MTIGKLTYSVSVKPKWWLKPLLYALRPVERWINGDKILRFVSTYGFKVTTK